MMCRKFVYGIVALASLVNVAQAQDANAGFYAGVGIGTNKLEDSDSGLSFDADDTAFTVFGGYHFNSWFSAEVGYIDGGTPTDTVSGVKIEVDSSAIEAALIGTVPLNDTFSVFGRVGLLAWDSEITGSAGSVSASLKDDGNDLSYGLGAALSVGPAADLRLQWRSADLDGTDLSLIDVAAIWKF